MKSQTKNDIAEMMGSNATSTDAEEMIALLEAAGFDPDAVAAEGLDVSYDDGDKSPTSAEWRDLCGQISARNAEVSHV